MNDLFLLPAVIGRELAGSRHIAVGSDGAQHASGALLAQALHPGTRVTVLGSRAQLFFSDGGRELFEAAAQGRIDAFMLGGGQIDGEANLNFMGRGSYPELSVRWPGNFGSPYLYSMVKKVVLVREEHSPRVLVPRVDYISASGHSPEGVRRPGGPSILVTSRCVFRWQPEKRSFRLESVHEGHDVAEVRRETGFDYDEPVSVPTTMPVRNDERRLLAGEIADRVAPTYPAFAERLRAAGREAARL